MAGAEITWGTEELGRLAEITVGHVGPMIDEYVVEGVPFLRSLNVRPFRIETADLMHISEAFHARLAKSALKPGNVLIVRTGTPGVAAVVPEWLPRANCADFVIVRPGPRLDSRFLAYYVNGAAGGQVDAHSVGAVQQHYNVGSAKQMLVALPPLAEQRAIGSVLGALDDKIDLNRHMSRTLEETASALFRSWFVDFDPVVAKAAGRSPFGVDAATAALFPASFEDSQLGPIPRGWQVTPLRDFGKWVSGATPARGHAGAWAGNVPWISAKAMTGFCIQTSTEHVDPAASAGRAHLVPAGTTLFVVRGMSLADEFRLGVTDRTVAFNQDLKAIVPNGTVEPIITGLFLLHSRAEILELVDEASHGTKKLETERVAALSLALPDVGVQHVLGEPLSAFFRLMCANEEESRTLAALRDTLLPKLLSGEIRLRDAERAVEAVA